MGPQTSNSPENQPKQFQESSELLRLFLRASSTMADRTSDMPALENVSLDEKKKLANKSKQRVATNFSKDKLERQDGTVRVYYADTYQFKADGKVLAVSPSENPKYGPLDVQVDQTVFHPQGGGQPADTGTISSGESVFKVDFVSVSPDGVIHHYGGFTSGKFEADSSVSMEIDAEKRQLYARIHSAGHLIDLAANAAGYGHLKPTKGYHFLDGSYVEYIGNIEGKDRPAAKEKIQACLNELIAQDLPVTVVNGDVRNVSYGDDPGCPCGGTHVNSTGQLGKVELTKLKKKQKNFRIGYKVVG